MKILIKNLKTLSWNSMYAGKHWAWRKNKVDEIEEVVIGEILRQFKSIKPFSRPVKILYEISHKGGQGVDPDNCFVKVYTDSLVKAKIIKDDSCEFVKEIVIRLMNRCETDQVVITIEPYEELSIK